MSEFRQNPITKQWVLIAPSRNKRPDQYATYSVMHGVPEMDHSCVFCPGNEHLNPEILRVGKDGKIILGIDRSTSPAFAEASADMLPQMLSASPLAPASLKPQRTSRGEEAAKDWELRIIPNKFASVEHVKNYTHKEFYISHSGNGDHEVVVTRRHNEPVALQSIAIVELSLKTFVERIKTLSTHTELAYVQIFHNHGRDAGASVIHPHYQIIATPIVPPHIHSEILGCYHYYQNNNACIYCDIIKEERQIKDRLVHESEHFIVISAYASRSPFETWILPKRHSARFEDMTSEEIKHLSFVLKVTLGQLYTKLSDPPLNFYIHNMPMNRGHMHSAHEEKSYHWHLTIFPRITIWAGFEFATGIPVNPIPPEVSAKFLKGDE